MACGPSVQVDDAKPQHNDVKGKEGDAKEAWGIAFACSRCNIDASPNLLTHVVLLSRVDHHRLVTWNCGRLRRSLNWVSWSNIGRKLGSTARRYHILSLVRLPTFSCCLLLLAAVVLSHNWFAEFSSTFITVRTCVSLLVLPAVWHTYFALEHICAR